MFCLPEYLGTALRVSYPSRRILFLHRALEGLRFSGLEGSGKKQVVANSMHRKDYPYSLLFNLPIYSSEVSKYYSVRLTFKSILPHLVTQSSKSCSVLVNGIFVV